MFRPLDLQTTISHSVNIQRVQQAQQGRSVTDQPDFSKELFKNNQQKNEQIQQSGGSEQGNRIREETPFQERQRRLKPRRYQKNSKPDRETAKNKPIFETEPGTHIDIKI